MNKRIQNGTELYHHGILGQKWGVRRFQNADGTYTAAGMKRYNKAKQDYDSAKKDWSNTKKQVRNGRFNYDDYTKSEQKFYDAKANLKKQKQNLKKSYQADKGRELYRRGNTIEKSEAKQRTARKITATVNSAAAFGIYATGQSEISRMINRRSIDISRIPQSTKAIGVAFVAANAANLAYQGYQNHKQKQMRAYWHKGSDVPNK